MNLKTINRIKRYLPNAVAVGTFIITVFVLSIVGRGTRQHLKDQEKINLSTQLHTRTTALEVSLSQRLEVANSMAAFAAHDLDNIGAHLSEYAEELLSLTPGLRSIQVAPNAVVTRIFPIEGNQAAKGHDLLNDPDRRPDILRTIDRGKLTLAGPLELIQGGLALIGRVPIFVEDMYWETNIATIHGNFWGLGIVVIDVIPLLQEFGIKSGLDELDFAVRVIHEDGSKGTVFFGDQSLFEGKAITEAVSLPDGSWEIAIIPRDGWGNTANLDLWIFRVFSFLVIIMNSIAAYWVTRRLLKLDILLNQESESRIDSTEKYKALFNGNSDALLVLTETGGILDVNQSALDIYGYSKSEFRGMSVGELATEKFTNAMTKNLSDVQTGKIQLESEHILKDGRVIPVEISAQTVSLTHSTFILSAIRDISERKQAEKTLVESESSLRTVFDNMMDVYYRLDAQGIILDASPSAVKLYGYDKLDDIIGRPSTDFLFSKAEKEKFVRAMEGKSMVKDYHLKHKHKDKSLIMVEVNAHLIYGSDGNMIGEAGVIRDITKQVKLEAQLRQSQKLEAVGTMVGGISHELNNILQSIFLYGGLIDDSLDEDSDLKSEINQLLIEGERARDIVRQILTFSRKSNDVLKPLNLCSIVESMAERERATLSPNISLVLDLSQTCGFVLSDKTQIHQILSNLCNNASHAMDGQGGVITISLHQIIISIPDEGDHECLELKVTDTGSGMSDETLEKIFDPFFTTKDVGKGTGLGLSVIHGIVEMMGGKISATSELGTGSTITILLPVVDSVDAEDVELSEARGPVSFQSVLLVDDEASIRKNTQNLLEKKGFSVDCAADGQAALELYLKHKNRYDIVITDLNMPNMSGLELTEQLRQHRSKIPILLSTGQLGVEDQEEYKNIGISGFIQKPWSVKDLTDKIGEL